jgi:hypothetical protein
VLCCLPGLPGISSFCTSRLSLFSLNEWRALCPFSKKKCAYAACHLVRARKAMSSPQLGCVARARRGMTGQGGRGPRGTTTGC